MDEKPWLVRMIGTPQSIAVGVLVILQGGNFLGLQGQSKALKAEVSTNHNEFIAESTLTDKLMARARYIDGKIAALEHRADSLEVELRTLKLKAMKKV